MIIIKNKISKVIPEYKTNKMPVYKRGTSFLIIIVSFMMLTTLYSCVPFNISDHKKFIQETSEPHALFQKKYINSNTINRIKQDKRYDSSVKESNYSKILYGNNNTAVILLHGFISSPFEVYFLAKELNKMGYTVYMPLIEGFGGSVDLANSTEYSSWQSTLKKSVEKLTPHYENIVLAGFSMGGTIVTDFLINSQNAEKITGAVLLAPYFKPKWSASQWISKSVGLVSDSISLNTIYKMCRSRDLIIPMANQVYYNSELPIKAANQLIKFGDKIRTDIKGKQIYLPTLFVFSDDDQTVNNRNAIKIAHKKFKNAEILRFSKNKKVRHQLALPAGNIMFESLCFSIINFLESLKD